MTNVLLCYRNFTTFVSTTYGNCYTFNSGQDNVTLMSERSGPFYGEATAAISFLTCLWFCNAFDGSIRLNNVAPMSINQSLVQYQILISLIE